MCRLLMADKKGMILLEEIYGAVKYLNFLEDQCGGHGNGFILVKNNEIIQIKKGLKLKNKKIYDMIKNKDYDYFIYHTRVASAGSVKESNCHPFWNNKKSFALCMNGTETDLVRFAKMSDKTDTQLVFEMIEKGIIPFKALGAMRSNYMGFINGGCFAFNNSYSPLRFTQNEDYFILASSFPIDFPLEIKNMAEGYVFAGDKIEERRYTSLANRGGYIVLDSKPQEEPYVTKHEQLTSILNRGWNDVDFED